MTHPMDVREIQRGIRLLALRTATLPPATHTNAYLLGMRQWGSHVQGILLTHHHQDHVGGAKWLTEQTGIPIWAHEETAKLLPDIPVQRILRDGDWVELDEGLAFQVLHTPGHAPGHICLWSPSRSVLVLGDMIASRGTILIAPDDGDMAEYIGQLDRLAQLGARLGLPAHGEPIECPSEKLLATAEHRRMREDKVLKAVQKAGESGATIASLLPEAYNDTPIWLWGLATLSTASHLDKLARDGVVAWDGAKAHAV